MHDLVWSGPMRDVSKTLGLSDNGLRKICVKAFVPLPTQGHWNKVHAGQQVKTTPLPPRPPGVSDTIDIGPWDYREYDRQLLTIEPVAPVFDEPIDAVRERVTRNLGQVVASKNLSPPHAAFRRQVEDDAKRAALHSWHTPIFNTPLEKRRLRILQGLFYGLSRLDCSVTVQGRETRTIYVLVGHRQVQIALERLPTRARNPGDAERLKLSILQGHSMPERIAWSDSDEKPLEAQLSEIAAEIIVTGELQYREHEQWKYEETIRQREEKKREEIKKRAEREEAERRRILALEAARLKRLTDSATDYRQAQDIRAFVQEVIAVSPGAVADEAVARWRLWALAQADRIDPIVSGRIWGTVNDADKS